MHGKKAALSWSVIHTIADSEEENILLKYNEDMYLFFINLVSGIFVGITALLFGVEMSFFSLGVIILYSFAMIGGNICYVKAIQTLPIGLANLIDSGGLFIILICDIFLGYITPKFRFFVLFVIFFLSIYVFSNETNKMKKEITRKKIDLKGIFILITSVIFYSSEPYFIKLASSKGANEFGINLVFYLVSIPFFYYLLQKKKKDIKPLNKAEKKDFAKRIIILGLLYAITDALFMFAYIGETPIIISLIIKLQVFFIVILSVIRKTDKMNWKKTVSLITGMGSIIWMTLLN